MNHQGSQSTSTKIERRIIEKNRRNQMKVLYSKLNSLLPNQNSKEALSLPDQIDEAINYIKSLETKLKKAQEKKESFNIGKKRSYTCTNFEAKSSLKSPQMEIREIGSTLEVVLITGLDNQFIFYEMIHILHEEQAQVLNASFSISGESIFHVLHAEITAGSLFDFGAAKVTERLKRFIYGSTSDVEFMPELWDLDNINPESWDF
ncbi:transcription factor bHLH162-like [Fagus crenata]|uniref:BHLH domain-containing protein n=1 Tax=Fagus sylvatica TaxID=28930 RepID=A0A2N9EEB2_FAGSY